MGTLTFPFTLTAGANENVNQLNSNLTAIQTVLNGSVDATNLAAAAVTTAKLADGAVSSAKMAPTVGLVQADANLTLSTSFQDVSGATVDITPDVASNLIVVAGFGWSAGTLSSSSYQLLGQIVVDGAQDGFLAFDYFATDGIAVGGGSIAATVVALDASAHTIKLQAKAGATSGTPTVDKTYTGFVYMLVAS